MKMVEKSQNSFFGPPWLVNLIVIALFVLGFGIRMLDLTDLPLDEVAGVSSNVEIDGPVMRTARGLGISFGDD